MSNLFLPFERSVFLERYQPDDNASKGPVQFERSVVFEGSQRDQEFIVDGIALERSVFLEEVQVSGSCRVIINESGMIL